VAGGDINGDGTADVIIGANWASPGGRAQAGKTQVVLGPLSPGTIELSSGANIVANGIDEWDLSGEAVVGADVTGDGYADLIIGAHNADPLGPGNAGAIYAYYGPLSPCKPFSSGTIELSTGPDITLLDSSNPGRAFHAGRGLDSGDINGDGAQDLIIGATRDTDDVGRTYVLFGPLGTPSAISAVVDIDPDVLNLNSTGQYVTAYIQLPEGENVADIDVSTVKLTEANHNALSTPLPIVGPTEIGTYDADGISYLMVKFDRQALIQELASKGLSGNVSLTVKGNLNNGTPFIGSMQDSIRVKGSGQ
jgi:hypothetical protein